MAKKLPSLSLFLLLLLAFQEMLMMPTEAATCETPSRYFTGLCFSRNNCVAICEKEGFSFGVCKRLKCVCAKDCNAGGGGGGNPGQDPPEEGPPDEGPPGGGEEPPVKNRKSLLSSLSQH